ncbi:MAG TPA: hypothetical protein VNY80_08085 [Steroidobacteraceae bacterium]|jgi:hypothetical protein|nr:hypothetical protein [Steroidobacteraceae bacterium]
MTTLNAWKAEVLRRFPKAEFIEECDGMTARCDDADCGWWLASSYDSSEPDCWVARSHAETLS